MIVLLVIGIILLIIALAILFSIHSDEKIKKQKQNKMEFIELKPWKKVWMSYSKKTINTQDICRKVVSILQERIDYRLDYYKHNGGTYNYSRLNDMDAIIFLVDNYVLTYGQKTELEHAERCNSARRNIPVIFYNIQTNRYYGQGVVVNKLHSSCANYHHKWEVKFPKMTCIETQIRHYRRINEQLNKEHPIKTKTMAENLYQIDDDYKIIKQAVTDTFRNKKMTLKEWNSYGYKKCILKKVNDYIKCEFGDAGYGYDPVEVRVYKHSTIAIIEGVKTPITIGEWQKAYDTKHISVGGYYIGAGKGIINIGCKYGTYDEIAKILKAWSSM